MLFLPQFSASLFSKFPDLILKTDTYRLGMISVIFIVTDIFAETALSFIAII